MRFRYVLALAAVVLASIAGAALAAHVVQVDPTTVPVGFLAAHNQVELGKGDVKALRRIVKKRRAGVDVFVQHVRLGANAATGWHSHPGPVFVTVVSGSLTYEDVLRGSCRRKTYGAGEGFVDQGFGHVHRAVAGAAGADFYATYVLRRGSENHLIPADAPEACVP